MTKILYFAALAVAAYFCWDYFQPQPQPQPLSLEEQIKAIAQSGKTSSAKLAQLAHENPSLAVKILRGKRLQVTGTLEKATIRGLNDELSLDLTGNDFKKVTFITKIARLHFEGKFRNFSRYEKLDDSVYGVTEIKVLEQNKISPTRKFERTLLYQENTQNTFEGIFKYINVSSVILDWYP